MSFWTLEYDGTEKTFQEWGFTDPRMSVRKLAVTTFRVRIPGATNLVIDPPIPFKGQVVIRRGRGEDFTGGEIVFQGRQITDQRQATTNPADVLTFGDAWWDLENLTFQQEWKSATVLGGIVSPTMRFSVVNLFQAFASAAVITNGAQLQEIIAWAVTCGVNIQAGLIDLGWHIQPYPVSAVSCASAVQICLKPTPGAACWIDMTTQPPTFNCRERNYHTALTLPYASGNHQSSELMPRYDMQVPQVVIQYRQTSSVTVGGQTSSWTIFPYDAWPLDATLPEAVRGGKQVGAMVVPIQLAGYQETDLMQKVTAGVLGNPPSLAWWKSKKPAMAAYTNLAYVAGSLKILDTAGTDITSTVLASYPNELLDGQVASWMKVEGGDPVGVQSVTVQAKFTYSEVDAEGKVWNKVGASNPHVVSVNTRLTNSAIGEQSYTILQSMDAGQTPVANLAQNIWTMLSWLFWDGTHSTVEKNDAGAPAVATIIDCRYALNLTGGAAAWETMLSPIHATDIDFMRGTTEIRFGLPKHVGPADLEQLLQFYKFRRVLSDPTVRSSGMSASMSGEIGEKTAKENTSNSKAPSQLLGVTFIQPE